MFNFFYFFVKKSDCIARPGPSHCASRERAERINLGIGATQPAQCASTHQGRPQRSTKVKTGCLWRHADARSPSSRHGPASQQLTCAGGGLADAGNCHSSRREVNAKSHKETAGSSTYVTVRPCLGPQFFLNFLLNQIIHINIKY